MPLPKGVTIDPNSITPIGNVTIDPNSIVPIGGTQAIPTTPPDPTWGQKIEKAVMGGAKDLGIGAGRGVANTSAGIGDLEHAVFPESVRNSSYGKVFENGLDTLKDWAQPANTMQSVGKGIEQAAEFLIPGAAEEDAARGIAKVLPQAEKAAPLVKAFAAGTGSGLVNKAQGGSFGAGFGAGAAGSGVAQGLKAFAPAIAESALNIRKLDRAYKPEGAIGKAILSETKGLRPGKVAESASDVLAKLNPELEAAADRASTRPAPKIRGFLQPPVEETPLANAPNRPGRLSKPIILSQADRPFPPMLEAPRMETELPTGGMNAEGQFRPQGVLRRPQVFENSENGMGNRNYIGEKPGDRGGPGLSNGVLRRRPPMSASTPPVFENNPSASLSGARGELQKAFQTAGKQGERTTMGQLQPMMTHLSEDMNGNPIAKDLTPRQLLDLKRGFGNEFIHRWNPETMEGVKGTAGRTYHQMAKAFEDAVPEAAPLNRRIGALIPVVKRGESAELNAPTAQRAFHRIAAHTGAGLGAVTGGYSGYRHGGAPGAIVGGAAGLLLPEIAASPEAQMYAARRFNSPLTGAGLRLGTGGMLQLEHKSEEAQDEDKPSRKKNR